jgi:hypothetical protein
MNVLPPPVVVSYSLSIQSNVQGAQVFINGNPAGNTPFQSSLPGGSYSVLVRAPGYLDFSQNVVVSGAAFVQANLVPISFSLSVSSNVAGADVLINGNPAGKIPFSTQIPGGSYTVVVRAPGYADFSQNIVVSGAAQVNANLQLLTYALSVASNVSGAQVFLNGNPAGKTPFGTQIPGGSYSVVVRAPGYVDFTQDIVVSGAAQVNATLQLLTFQLNVASSVGGAEVFLNGNRMGTAPFVGMLPPGVYGLIVRAPGYLDFSTQVNMSGAQTVNASLVPSPASWQLAFPEAFVNRDLKGQHLAQVQLFIDGTQQKTQSGQVSAGRHVIRLVTGGMATETTVDLQSGKAYTFEPSLGLSVR